MKQINHQSRYLKAKAASLAFCFFSALASPAVAGGMSVSPTSIIVHAPMTMGTLTIRVTGDQLVVGQVRVMRTDDRATPASMQPTQDVVASPPAMKLRPAQEMTIRLVRKAARPIKGRECYRVLVDQIPRKPKAGTVIGFVLRQSIPLCFVAGG